MEEMKIYEQGNSKNRSEYSSTRKTSHLLYDNNFTYKPHIIQFSD